nr:hypothetical protein [Carnobacterium funditum]
MNRQIQNGKKYDQYISVYDADTGQSFYEKQRMNCAGDDRSGQIQMFLLNELMTRC